jgi:hypothetical protein
MRTALEDGTRNPDLRGQDQFNKILDHFGRDNVDAIKGNWQYDTNLNGFNDGIAQGMTPEQAAANTWTGKQAAAAGFTNVEIEQGHMNPDGTYSQVKARFTR